MYCFSIKQITACVEQKTRLGLNHHRTPYMCYHNVHCIARAICPDMTPICKCLTPRYIRQCKQRAAYIRWYRIYLDNSTIQRNNTARCNPYLH